MPSITVNKKGLHEYQVLEKFEAGIVLSGPEVKSVKGGQINLKGSHVTVDHKNEVWLLNAHISPYKFASRTQIGYDPTQSRKLLLTKKEVDYLRGKSKEQGLTIMPISVYTKGSLIKIEIGLVKGKKQRDKREDIKKRDLERQLRNKIRR
ncbi:MAG: SsrA-binding protein SmpB [Candidatus Buchananbacteria bacterium]|nr:SsrA-binding protein SmpB [Candidatus Buchananbacteria bacterium]